MGARLQRRAYSRVIGASTAKRPAALGYAGAGPAPALFSALAASPPLSVTIQKGMALEVTLLGEPVSKGESGRPCLGDPPPTPLTLYTYRG